MEFISPLSSVFPGGMLGTDDVPAIIDRLEVVIFSVLSVVAGQDMAKVILVRL